MPVIRKAPDEANDAAAPATNEVCGNFYVPRCCGDDGGLGFGADLGGGHSRLSWYTAAEDSDDDNEMKDGSEWNGHGRLSQLQQDELVSRQLPSSLANVLPGSLKCSCFDPNCKLRRFFRHRVRQMASRSPADAVDALQAQDIDPRSQYWQQHVDRPELMRAREALVREAGGAEFVGTVYQCCVGLWRSQPDLLTATATDCGSTVLTEFCGRKPASADGAKLLQAQILAFCRLYAENDPDMLFARNRAGTCALDLAALGDKTAAARYLALLYGLYGRDVNEPNAQGHTVAHLMARKGDDCAYTLRQLLLLRHHDDATRRLLRMDVVNAGGKTPLDVAVACQHLFAVGKDRALYTDVIQIFHDTIAADAGEMLSQAAASNPL